jgi:hypothetical protein
MLPCVDGMRASDHHVVVPVEQREESVDEPGPGRRQVRHVRVLHLIGSGLARSRHGEGAFNTMTASPRWASLPS